MLGVLRPRTRTKAPLMLHVPGNRGAVCTHTSHMTVHPMHTHAVYTQLRLDFAVNLQVQHDTADAVLHSAARAMSPAQVSSLAR